MLKIVVRTLTIPIGDNRIEMKDKLMPVAGLATTLTLALSMVAWAACGPTANTVPDPNKPASCTYYPNGNCLNGGDQGLIYGGCRATDNTLCSVGRASTTYNEDTCGGDINSTQCEPGTVVGNNEPYGYSNSQASCPS